jgi:hypothetical protein
MTQVYLKIKNINLGDICCNDISVNNFKTNQNLTIDNNFNVENDSNVNNFYISNDLNIKSINPTKTLEINGDISFSGNLYNGNTIYTGGAGWNNNPIQTADLSMNNLTLTNDISINNNTFINNDLSVNGNITLGGNLISSNSLTTIKQIKSVTFTQPKSISFTDATNNVFIHIPEFDISLTTSDTNCERLLMLNLNVAPNGSSEDDTKRNTIQGLVKQKIGTNSVNNVVTSNFDNTDTYPASFGIFSLDAGDEPLNELLNIPWHYVDNSNVLVNTDISYSIHLRCLDSDVNNINNVGDKSTNVNSPNNFLINQTKDGLDDPGAHRNNGISTFTIIEFKN